MTMIPNTQNTASGLKGDPDRLYALLPLVYQQRDAEAGYPLRDLLRVVAEQVEVVEDDIARLYENWFIETCDDWVVPYIGEAVGVVAADTAGTAASRDARAVARGRHLLPRAQVADGVRALRRKGTLALLEETARTGANWPARVVEFYRLVGWHQHTRFPRHGQGATVDLRDGARLAHLGTPFDTVAHTVDVRRPNSGATPGRYNIPSIGLFLWRLRPHTVNGASARHVEGAQGAYTFSLLGNDCPLFHGPSRMDEEAEVVAEPTALPVPITRRLLERRIRTEKDIVRGVASGEFYGADKSIAVFAPGWPTRNAPQPIPAEQLLVTDLSDWRYEIPGGFVGLDPETGRLLFPKAKMPPGPVRVRYRYGFSADMGGGEYPRRLSQPGHARLYRVAKQATAGDPEEASLFNAPSAALAQWEKDRAADGARTDAPGRPLTSLEHARKFFPAAVIEIEDSEEYVDRIVVDLRERETLIVRGADGARPILRLLDYLTDQSDALPVRGTTGSRFILDGIWIIGLGLVVRGDAPQDETDEPTAEEPGTFAVEEIARSSKDGPDEEYGTPEPGDAPACEPEPPAGVPPELPPVTPPDLCEVRIRHCTLVPGWGLKRDCEPLHPDYPSVELENTETRLVVEQSILGTIRVSVSETQQEPVTILLSDSILDATSNERDALGATTGLAYATLTATRCTVFGRVEVHAIALAEDTLFCGNVLVARRQEGCLRFCYVPHGSRTPRRFACQPDGVTRDLAEGSREIEEERRRVAPRFTSVRYGRPAYGQLARDCTVEITRGAEDESEMGAFHDLYGPQRETLLRKRLDEVTPEDRNAGLLFVN